MTTKAYSAIKNFKEEISKHLDETSFDLHEIQKFFLVYVIDNLYRTKNFIDVKQLQDFLKSNDIRPHNDINFVHETYTKSNYTLYKVEING